MQAAPATWPLGHDDRPSRETVDLQANSAQATNKLKFRHVFAQTAIGRHRSRQPPAAPSFT
jgi:hypothetical protein